MKILNLLNKRFGKLLVIKYSGLNKYKKATWLCRCDCGNEKIIASTSLNYKNRTKSCGCLKKIKIKKEYTVQDSINLLWYDYIRDAKKKNRIWNLTKEQFINITSKSCYYCGETPFKIKKNYKWNGIDRIDSSKGYILSNCVSCCWKCNRMKMDLSITEFFNHINKIILNLSPVVSRDKAERHYCSPH